MKYRRIFALLFVLILSLTACGREQVPPGNGPLDQDKKISIPPQRMAEHPVPPPVKGQPPGFLSKEGKYWMTCVKGRRRTAVSVP